MTNPAAKIGYDGNQPEFVQPRDIDGAGKRSIQGIQNVNSDRLGYLEAHGRINATHLAAGRKFQASHELANASGFAQSQNEPRSPTSGRTADSMTVEAQMAGRRVKAALAYLGEDGGQIIRLVAIGGTDGQGLSLAKAESVMRLPVGGGIGALRVALGALARHYGLA